MEGVELTQLGSARREKMLSWYNESQRLAIGSRTCERGWQDFSPSSDKGCSDYHAVFPLLDLLQMASSPQAHKEFYQDALWQPDNTIYEKEARILISGLATPSMAEIVLDATKKSTKIDVLDICATPLLTCKSVFKPEEVARMQFIQKDAKDYSEGQYDMIVTDAFLTRFAESERLKVLQNWAKMLKPDGKVVTTWRIGEKKGEKGYGNEEDKRNFRENFQDRLKKWHVPIGSFLDMLSIFGQAESYAEKMHSYSGQAIEEIKAFMEQCFADVRIEESGWVYDVVTRKYAQIVAYKPKK